MHAPDPCVGLCERFSDLNSECASLATSCQRIFQSLGEEGLRSDICQSMKQECSKAQTVLNAANSKKCKCQ